MVRNSTDTLRNAAGVLIGLRRTIHKERDRLLKTVHLIAVESNIVIADVDVVARHLFSVFAFDVAIRNREV